MHWRIHLKVAAGLIGMFYAVAHASASAAQGTSVTGITQYLGRWDITLRTPAKEYGEWLEITNQDGHLAARMVARWGHARPLPRVDLQNGTLLFVSPKSEEDSPGDMVYKGTLHDGRLSGTVNGADGKGWQWVAVPAPKLERAGLPKWGKPIQLFDGKDLQGWHQQSLGPTQWNSKAPEWTVVDGALVSPGHGPELINDVKFEDFKLHLEFNCGPSSNSGVYLRGRYETQVENDSVSEPPSHHTGGVYGYLAPSPEQPRSTDKWQTYDITLIGRKVTVVLNGITVIDHQEIPGITGGALDSHEGLSGPIYLQGSEEGHVKFRNIVITPAQ